MTEGIAGDVRTLVVKSRGRHERSAAERRARQSDGEEPNSTMLEDRLGSDVLDEESLSLLAGRRAALYRRLPTFLAQAIEARICARRYDVVITWSERHSVAVAALFALTRARTPHVAMAALLSKPSVRIPFRVFRSGITAIVTWSSVQRDLAVGSLGFRTDQVVLVRHPVDLTFFRPMDAERHIIFSAGSTMRDFPTLVQAAGDLGLPVRIAASLVVELDGFRAKVADVRKELSRPSSVQVSQMEPLELRSSYAESRVTVVPLRPSDMDCGVNVVLEAMAMGRPVIVSRTIGQADVVDDGVTGFYVPPGDPAALRSAIQKLLDDPDLAETVGSRARQYVESHHSYERFVDRVGDLVHEVAAIPRAAL